MWIEILKPCFERFAGWAGEFQLALPERKKIIISQLASRIEIAKGYVITIEFNTNYEQFCEGVEGEVVKQRAVYQKVSESPSKFCCDFKQLLHLFKRANCRKRRKIKK